MRPLPELLPAALERAMRERGIEKITEMAAVVGVGTRDLRRVMGRKRKPNKRTYGKYAQFLNVTPEAIEAMVGDSSVSAAKFFYSEAVDLALRSIQEEAVNQVVGAIRPDLVRALVNLTPKAQAQVFDFIKNIVKQQSAPAPVLVKPKKPQAPAAKRRPAPAITPQRLARSAAKRASQREPAARKA